MGSVPAGQYLRVQKTPRVTEQHLIRLFVGKQHSEILYKSAHRSLSMPRWKYCISTMTSNVTIKQVISFVSTHNKDQCQIDQTFLFCHFGVMWRLYYNSYSFRVYRLIIIYLFFRNRGFFFLKTWRDQESLFLTTHYNVLVKTPGGSTR